MSGECQICHEHCLDCKCGVQTLGCDPPGTNIKGKFSLCPPPDCLEIKVLADPGFETYLRDDGNIGVRPVEKIDHPPHYQGNKYEVIDIIEDFKLDFHLGNAIKYILRAGKKDNKLDDLNKAIWYLERACQNIGAEILFNEQE